jgi:hypothetical protein
MTRSDPPLHRHLLTRSDLARLAVPAATILDWLGNGALEPVGVLGDGASGDPVFTVIAPELRRELVPRLSDLGKPAVVLTPLRVRSLLVRARMAMASSPTEQSGAGLETAPTTASVEIENAAAGADQLAVQDLATVLQEVATEIEVDVEVMLKLAEEEALLEAEAARLAEDASRTEAGEGARFADAFPPDAVDHATPGAEDEDGADLVSEQGSEESANENDACFDIDDLASAFAAEEQPSSPTFVDGAVSTPAGSDPLADAIGEPTSEPVVVTDPVADASTDAVPEASTDVSTTPTLAAETPTREIADKSDRELADEALDCLTSEPPAQIPDAPTEATFSDPHADTIGEPISESVVPMDDVAMNAVAETSTAPTVAAETPTREITGKSDRELADEALDCLTSEPPAQIPDAPTEETSTMQSETDPIASSMAWEEPAAPPSGPAAATASAAEELSVGEFSGLPDALDAVLGEFAAKPVERSPVQTPADPEAQPLADSPIDLQSGPTEPVAAPAEPASSATDTTDAPAVELEPSPGHEPTPVLAAPTPESGLEPLRTATHDQPATEEIVARLDRTTAALTRTGVSMQRVESFLGDLKHTLDDLSHRPAPAPLDVQPLVEALQVGIERATAQSSATNAVLTSLSERLGGLGQQVEHGMQQAVAAISKRADEPGELPHTAPAAAPTSLLVAPAERTPIALLALAALVLGWSVLFWFKTGSPRLALGTLIAANLVGCCLLLSRRPR